jgi:ATP-dependent helicase HrpB
VLIDSLLPEARARLRSRANLVLTATPGAGKTTGVPPALLEECTGEILVLEPRRLAARMAARRVAALRGEAVGETVGYAVRFEEVAGPATRLRFLTEGVLTRRMASDPELGGVSAVVLDEFHERHLETDLALALVRHLQRTRRPDLSLWVMSATLDPDPVRRFLGDAAHLHAEGRLHPLEIRHRPHSAAPLEEQVAAAVEQLLAEGLDGDVLVFLPGAAEIRRAARACEPLARRADLLVAPLYGDLPAEEQDRAVSPGPQRKVILATNLAESSITIEGVTAVVDSGLARIASDSPWTGLPRLQVGRVSRASCVQRAGRAGRLRPGRVIRLYPEEGFLRRPAQDPPELLRRELSPALLLLLAAGRRGFADLEWLDAPPAAAVDAASTLLATLEATDGQGRLTPLGRRMARLPLHPRLARLVLEAARLGAGRDGIAAAALLSLGARLPEQPAPRADSDLYALLESDWDPRARQVVQQLRRLVPASRPPHEAGDGLCQAALAAFPDRVARRRANLDLLLAAGGSARLSAQSAVREADFLVAIEVDDRPDRGLPLVRIASAIQPEWLLDRFPHRVTEHTRLEWDRQRERVDIVEELRFDALALDETRSRPEAEADAAAALLAAKAWEAGLRRFCDPEELESWLARVDFASRHAAVPKLDEGDVREALRTLCHGLSSFAELEPLARQGGLIAALAARLPAGGSRLVEELAPSRLRLPGGRTVRIHYARGQPPWIASRLQDFFGLTETPRVAGGAVPVVVHLLAPNQRPVQMTTDLAGFWERLYPQVRRELSRRYPKHAWPEKP